MERGTVKLTRSEAEFAKGLAKLMGAIKIAEFVAPTTGAGHKPPRWAKRRIITEMLDELGITVHRFKFRATEAKSFGQRITLTEDEIRARALGTRLDANDGSGERVAAPAPRIV